MRVLVFGGSGRTGRQVVSRALAAGDDVTVFTRDAGCVLAPPELQLVVFEGDILDPAAVDDAVRGHEAVVLAIGAPRHAPECLSEGTANVLAAMRAHGVRRLVVLSSFGVAESRAQAGPQLGNEVLSAVGHAVVAHKEMQEELVRASGLDWVLVRPTHITDGPARGALVAIASGDVSGRAVPPSISREEVADFVFAQLHEDRNLHKAVTIGENLGAGRGIADRPGDAADLML